MRRYQALDLLQAVIKQLENVILPSCFRLSRQTDESLYSFRLKHKKIIHAF